MNFEDIDLQGRYTYRDYLSWTFDQLVELIRGKVFKMSPAPSRYHQEVSTRLLTKIQYGLGSPGCKVYHAPFDVRLPLSPGRKEAEEIETVVQPDISVICDRSKLDDRGCLGAPDWIIEILSPSTSDKDRKIKFGLYEEAGVREYWIIDPVEKNLLIYSRNEAGRFVGERPFVEGDTVSPSIFPHLQIELAPIFPDVDMSEEELLEYQRQF